MKVSKKKISLLIVVLISVGILFLGKFSYNNEICQDLEVEILDTKPYTYWDAAKLKSYIMSEINQDVVGGKCKDINLNEIETRLNDLPFVRSAEVYRQNASGIIHVDVKYRHPVLKVYLNNAEFYVDADGYVFPLMPYKVPYVLVANGKFDLEKTPELDRRTHLSQLVDTNESVLYQAYKLARYIVSDRFWKHYITQIYMSDQGLELVPRLGDFTIIFGDISEYEKKFGNLKAFLDNLDRIGWTRYKSINLKYTNQIVCTKK